MLKDRRPRGLEGAHLVCVALATLSWLSTGHNKRAPAAPKAKANCERDELQGRSNKRVREGEAQGPHRAWNRGGTGQYVRAGIHMARAGMIQAGARVSISVWSGVGDVPVGRHAAACPLRRSRIGIAVCQTLIQRVSPR